jgi:PAS domain S-box-containing protein
VTTEPEDFCVVEPISDERSLVPLVLESTNVSIAMIDNDLRYRFVNEKLASTTGHSIEAHIGKTVRQILGKPGETLEGTLRQAFTAGKSLAFHVTAKLPLRPTVGKWIVNYVPIESPKRIQTICAVALEITDVKVTENLEQFLFNLAGKLIYLKDALSRSPGSSANKSPNLSWAALLEESAGDVLQALGSLPGVTVPTPESFSAPTPAASGNFEELSPRQEQVLRLLAQSKSNKQIGTSLGISERTVEAHRRQVMRRLGLHSLGELIHFAIRHHLVEPE